MATLRNKVNTIIAELINKVQYPILELFCQKKKIYAYCFCNRYLFKTKKHNIGDDLNMIFLENCFGGIIIKPEYSLFSQRPTYAFIGSILEYVCNQNRRVFVWGTGFKFSKNRLDSYEISKNKYLAVRGPLTRDIVLKSGGECPEIYGDPGILLSQYFKINKKNIYKFGIIPHNTEINTECVRRLKSNPIIHFLDIVNYSTLRDFLEQMNSCEYILSSSLHGIIIADSYNIPNLWVRFSENIDGDGFKYRDYFLGARKNAPTCLDLTKEFDVEIIMSELKKWTPTYIDKRFVDSCPFDIKYPNI